MRAIAPIQPRAEKENLYTALPAFGMNPDNIPVFKGLRVHPAADRADLRHGVQSVTIFRRFFIIQISRRLTHLPLQALTQLIRFPREEILRVPNQLIIFL